jgi:hypothetical protein
MRGSDHTLHVRLDDALWSRVSLLGEEERRIVEAIAVAGLPTSLDLIAQAASIPRRELAQRMATLRAANLVKVSGSNAARRIEPYHDRVREAVVLHLDAETRRGWHERLARGHEASAERDVERLAVHWEAAGDAARAATLFREAGDRATTALAFDRAADFYRRALALGGASLADRRKVEYALGDALFNAGRGDEAGRIFLSIAGDGTDRASLETRVRAATAFFGSGHFADGVVAIRSVLAIADLPFPEGRFSVIFQILWYRLLLRLRGLSFKLREASTISQREMLRFDVCSAAAFGIGMADTIRGAVFQYLGARLCLRLGDAKRATRGLCGLSLSLCTGGLKTAKWNAEVLRKARALGATVNDPYCNALIAGASGFGAYMLEEWTDARRFLLEAEVGFRDLHGVTYELATVRMMLGRALMQLGRLNELDPYVGAPLRDAIRRNDVYSLVNTRATAAALLDIARDDLAGAEEHVKEATRTISGYRFQMQHVYCLNSGCTLDLYREQEEAVLKRLEEYRVPLREALFERVQSVRVILVGIRARAHLGLAAKRKDGRDEHLAQVQACARQLGREGLRGATALSHLYYACIASIRGDKGSAVALLREAMAGFDERDMSLHGAAARDALAKLVGGDEGGELTRVARERFEAQRVGSPARFVRLYAPGLTS